MRTINDDRAVTEAGAGLDDMFRSISAQVDEIGRDVETLVAKRDFGELIKGKSREVSPSTDAKKLADQALWSHHEDKLIVAVDRSGLTLDNINTFVSPVLTEIRNNYDTYNDIIERIHANRVALSYLEKVLDEFSTAQATQNIRLSRVQDRLNAYEAELTTHAIDKGPPVSAEALGFVRAEASLRECVDQYGEAAREGNTFKVYALIALFIFALDGVVNYLIAKDLLGLTIDYSFGLALGTALSFSIGAHFAGQWLKYSERVIFTRRANNDTSSLNAAPPPYWLRLGSGFRRSFIVFFQYSSSVPVSFF